MTPKYDFSGKVAIITGSSTGIGEAIALQLAQYGARVVLTGRNVEKLKNVVSKITKILNGLEPLVMIGDLSADVTFPSRLINETLAKFGRLDVLINNAGAVTLNGLASPNLLAEFDRVFHLNVRTVVELTQLAVPHLEKTHGNIVNISSILGIHPYQTFLVYSSSKAAIDMVTKSSALELGPKRIRVNSINPGPVRTEFLRSIGLEAQEHRDAFYQNEIENSLMKRIGTAEDIANLASFLASDDAKNITGSTLVSDSGALIKCSG